jgi:hypothetical protein
MTRLAYSCKRFKWFLVSSDCVSNAIMLVYVAPKVKTNIILNSIYVFLTQKSRLVIVSEKKIVNNRLVQRKIGPWEKHTLHSIVVV